MSLINEALKKAQRQRSLDAAPLSSAPSGVAAAAVTTHVRAASHRRSHAPVWFGLGLLALGVGATVVIMRYGVGSDAPPAIAKTTPAPVALQPAPVAMVPTQVPAPAALASDAAVVLPPITPITSSPTPAPLPPAPVVAAPTPPAFVAPVPAPAPITPVPAPVAAPVPAVATPPVAVAPINMAALSDTERATLVYAFLNSARLTGVRGTGTAARVLMNERVYRLNDIVDIALGLRLSGVQPNLMVFTDALGKTYEKPY